MITHYDSTPLREQDRLEYWHELICRLFPRAAGRRQDNLPFAPKLARSVLGTVEVSDIRCNALRYDRMRNDQRQDQSEEFLVSWMLSLGGFVTLAATRRRRRRPVRARARARS